MRVCEAERLARQQGCSLKPVGQGMFKVIRSPDNWGYITKRELNRTNAAKFISFYVPQARERVSI